MNQDCIFCKIVEGTIPAKIVYQDDRAIAFHDIQPHTPVHLLIIPKKHIPSVNELEEVDESLIGHLAVVARQLAKEQGISQNGYRLVINTGPDSGQSIFHLHLHLLGGRKIPFRLG